MSRLVAKVKFAMENWSEGEWYAFVILVALVVWLLIARPLHFIGA